MTAPSEFTNRAAAARKSAALARKIANAPWQDEDRARFLQSAAEFDSEATDLEQQAAVSSRDPGLVLQSQPEQQQQKQIEPDKDPKP
jgi:hypothetical protein